MKNNKPWSLISDERLAWLNKIANLAKELTRGCDCEYGYKCSSCSLIIDITDLTEEEPT
jgi:hypothetical protein